ncbi:thiamine-phosphate kinase [Candidatus Sordicultor fermentans]|uniref:thiamine-phosphate kinase n=1 Tax=Candidatus Sordicultor fermentans TaxID=1953203 RepID=UPI0016AA242A|nr:thiamine-phosphate kinase [Candidatus Atribacteria bacterium]
MKLKEWGEFGIIDYLKNFFPSRGKRVVLGIEDDCAVVRGPRGFFYLLTCDSQVENVHFILSLFSPFSLGKRVLAVNLSDIAAMGGKPLFALLSWVLRPDMEAEWLKEFMRGIKEEAEAHGVDIIGGNLSRTESQMVFDLTLVGEVENDRPLLLRRNARPGDLVLVTGTLGDSRAGLEIALRGSEEEKEKYSFLLKRFFTPSPRLQVGRLLHSLGERVATIDVSDGFSQDLGHIVEESEVGAVVEVDKLPISPSLRKWSEEENKDPFLFALSGGEDFELIFTVPRERGKEVKEFIEIESGIPVTIVGEVVSQGGVSLRRDGREEKEVASGWNHFQ